MHLLRHALAELAQKLSVYDQEISQSHTLEQPVASWGRATEHL